MMDPITKAEEPTQDTRPEPGPMPDMYTARYWEWDPKLRCLSASPLKWETGWKPQTWIMTPKREQVEQEIQKLIAAGCRRVQLITLKGD